MYMDTDLQAYISSLHYDVPVGDEGKNNAYDTIDNKLKEHNFIVDRKNSDHNILTTFNSPENILHLNHRGTSKSEDIVSDLAFGVGLEGYNSQFEERRKNTKEILKQYKNTNIYLSGHSLGGATLNYTLAKSPSIVNNIKQANTFNPAIHPYNSNLEIEDKKHKAQLNKKVRHHRAGGDLVSKWAVSNKHFGKVIKYKVKKENQGTLASHKLHHFSKYID